MVTTHGNRADEKPLDNVLATLDAATLAGLPFKLHPQLMNVWGAATDKKKLTALIAADGGIRDPLLCAKVDGEVYLYDGFSRLSIYFERKAAGTVEAFPKHEVNDFGSFGDVLLKVLSVQSSRRNLTPPQLAYYALEAKRQQGYDISPRNRGNQPKSSKASALALKPLPSMKKLAEETGISDFSLREIQRLLDHPTILADLVTNDPERQLSVKQARHRREGHRRDANIHNRTKLVEERRKALAGLTKEACADLISPCGFYTTDTCKGMDRIAAKSVGFICTSIPYACDVEYDVTPGFDGNLTKYLNEFVREPFARYKTILEYGGRVAINFDDTYRSIEKGKAKDRHTVANFYNMVKEIGKIAEDEFGFLPVGRRVWYKQNCPNYFSHGSRDCRTPADNPNTEHIYIWGNESVNFPCAEADSDISQEEFDEFAPTNWYIKPQLRQPQYIEVDGIRLLNPDFHPVPYPEELVYRLIRFYCPKDAVVLDPFSGSGTTCFVAAALGRPYIGLDNSQFYNESARKRLATLDGLTTEEKLGRIERFSPADGERADGFKKHSKHKNKLT